MSTATIPNDISQGLQADASHHRKPPPPKRIAIPPELATQRGPPKAPMKGFYYIGGIALFAFSAYGAAIYFSYRKQVARGKELRTPTDVRDRYDGQAKVFDKEVDWTEWLMLLNWRRKQLMSMARGDVLEVSVGTGRNFKYYPLEKCDSVTVVDYSHEMIEEARMKFKGICSHLLVHTPIVFAAYFSFYYAVHLLYPTQNSSGI
jgi:methyltransferase OMS1, mitochondrial